MTDTPPLDLDEVRKGLEQAARLLRQECFHKSIVGNRFPDKECCSWTVAAHDVENAIRLVDEVEASRELISNLDSAVSRFEEDNDRLTRELEAERQTLASTIEYAEAAKADLREELEAERETMRGLWEALEFYEDEENYDEEWVVGKVITTGWNCDRMEECEEWEPDHGQIARAALKSHTRPTE